MADYEPMVSGITTEFQGLGKVPFSEYAKIVTSKGLPPNQEKALMEYASDVWAINNGQWSAPQQTSQPKPQPREGFGGLLGDLGDLVSGTIGAASDIARIPVGLANSVVTFGREVVIDPVYEAIVGSTEDIVGRTRPYMAQSGNNPYRATTRRQADVIQELNRMG